LQKYSRKFSIHNDAKEKPVSIRLLFVEPLLGWGELFSSFE